MYLKLMSGEDIPDDDNRKAFSLVECSSFQFKREDNAAFAHVNMASGPVTFQLEGNVYVLNNAGKTIETFGIATYARRPGSSPHEDTWRNPHRSDTAVPAL